MKSARRQPKQSRSEHRISDLLDAAERTFVKLGFHATTTNHIVKEANASVGALYRFFPNKEAILVAVADRYIERLQQIRHQCAADTGADVGELVSRRVDRYRQFFLSAPVIRVLIDEWPSNAQVRELFASFHADSVKDLEKLVKRLGVAKNQKQAHVTALVCERVLGSLHSLAIRQDLHDADSTIAELKRLLTLYLSTPAPTRVRGRRSKHATS